MVTLDWNRNGITIAKGKLNNEKWYLDFYSILSKKIRFKKKCGRAVFNNQTILG